MATNVQRNNKKVQTKNESVHEKKKVRKEYYLMAIFALIFFVSIGTVIYVLLTSESKIISMDDRPIKDVEKVKQVYMNYDFEFFQEDNDYFQYVKLLEH